MEVKEGMGKVDHPPPPPPCDLSPPDTANSAVLPLGCAVHTDPHVLSRERVQWPPWALPHVSSRGAPPFG